MGLYNAIFGYNEGGAEILAALHLTPSDFARYRDAFVTNGEIAVYTRLGGGNRDGYVETIEKLQKHPLYLRDNDDSFDSTYATFYFRIPDEYRDRLLPQDIGDFNPSAKWQEALDNLNKQGEVNRIANNLPNFTKVVGTDPKES